MSETAGQSVPPPGRPMQAHSFNEVRYYLTATPCCSCGKGPLEPVDPAPAVGKLATINARCSQCGQQCSYEMIIQQQIPASGPLALTINQTNEPSRIVDLGQWLGLFYLLVESGAKTADRSESRRLGYQAALCLREALKFYGDNELPPREAFFNHTQPFMEHPENFARQRLADMLSKLPALPKMARAISRDEAVSRVRWWQFWRRGK